MKNRNKGFILLMTLCAVLVISALLITCLHHILIYRKALNKQESQHQNFYQLEDIAKRLAQIPSVTTNRSCVATQDVANETVQWLIKGRGCLLTVSQTQYRYIIEDLGDFPCLILHNKQQKRATHHIRVSVLLLANEEHQSSLLQLRFIKPALTENCMGEEHVVNEGISSWRYLATLNL
ncbi:hypothetical protein [Legionella fallonii]|uniref:Tfp pilus assembly protein PilX n=1 Tax=Legionella fallonii LLAP-10 TaxID=1212491 RepID=A0A098G517_9GAMM|nr:hypothetical protein [Legionella fallonii]CEG57562.1 conserved exported protein of unknown function [Legionella fallonii LLAP-10]